MQRAVKSQKKLRMTISGASGSGKTRSALEIARYLTPGGKIGLLDTEYRSSSAYADKIEFDSEEILENYDPQRLIDWLAKHGARYDVLIVDSLSHFWNGNGGILDIADQAAKRMAARGGKTDTFAAWKEATPIYNRLVAALLSCPTNLICTMRAKQDYSREGGKVQKLGVSPEMRDSFSFEFDVETLMDEDHNMVVGKTRFDSLDKKVFHKPGKQVADLLLAELNTGAPSVTTGGVIDLATTPAPTEPPTTGTAEIPPPPATASLVDTYTQFLLMAAGNAPELERLRAEIKTKVREGLIDKDEYAVLGQVYTKAKAAA